jgi:hypothetical protein
VRRLLVPVMFATALQTACASRGEGPADAAPQEDLVPRGAIDQAAVRSSVLSFVAAYAAAPGDDGAALDRIVAGRELRRWVHWLVVQNHEVGIPLQGLPDVGWVGPAVVPQGPGQVRDLGLLGSVSFAPATGSDPGFDPFTRTLDGPVRCLRAPDGRWRVIGFTRDGVWIHDAFQVLHGVRVDAGPKLTIQIDSLEAYPTWQFNMRVTLRAGPDVTIPPSGATIVDDDDRPVADARTVTASLARVHAGRPAEGFLAFDALPDVTGLTLRLDLGSGGRTLQVEFPLEGLLEPVAAATDQASPSPEAG